MNRRIILKSFRALSFEGIKIIVVPAQAMAGPQATPVANPTLTRQGELPVESGLPVDSATANRAATTGHFQDRNQQVVNGVGRVAPATTTSSAR